MANPTPKRIWLVNLFFGVGVAPTGPLLESVAVGLQKDGWRVEVLTGNVAYNKGVAAQQRRFTGTIHTLRTGSAPAAGFGGRLISWMLFYFRTAWFAFTHRLPDKVLMMTTPPYLHLIFVVRNCFARRKAQLILWNQDSYPEVLAAVGMVRPTSLLFKFLLALQRWGVRRVEKVIALDQAMRGILESHGGRDVRVIPNWEIPFSTNDPLQSPELLHCIASAKTNYRFLVLYTGNYGWGHDLTILFDWLRQRPQQRDFYFLFVGGGEKWPDLFTFRARAPNCVGVFPYIPKTQMRSLLERADFGLVTLERSCVGLMSPSKIHGYLMCGKPLIYLGPNGSNVADAIGDYQCGMVVDERDRLALANCLMEIANERIAAPSLRQNACKAFSERYSESVGVGDIIRLLSQLDVGM